MNFNNCGWIMYRGSISDLATDIAQALTKEECIKLSKELLILDDYKYKKNKEVNLVG
jgi:hypothetical protein